MPYSRRRLYVEPGATLTADTFPVQRDVLVSNTLDPSSNELMAELEAARQRIAELEVCLGTVTNAKITSEVFQEPQRLLKTIGDSLQASLFVKDTQGRYTFANPTFFKTFAPSLEQVVGLTDFDLFPSETSKELRANDQRVMVAGSSETVEESGIFPVDGRHRCFLSSKIPLQNDSGKVTGILGISVDITERKEGMKVLREKEEALQQQAKDLEEMNTTLTVLLARRDQEKQTYEKNALNTLKTLVFPFLEKLSASGLSPDQKSCLAVATTNLNSVYSPFADRLAFCGRSLTPSEMHIVELIRQGRSSKEIALSLGLSSETILTHRKNIRAKFGLQNQKVNLYSFLQSLESEPHD